MALSAAATLPGQQVRPGALQFQSPGPKTELQRTIVLELHNVTLAQALDSIEHKAGVRVIFNRTDVETVHVRISLHEKAIAATDALNRVLAGTGFVMRLFSTGEIIVGRDTTVSATPIGTPAGASRISGRISDATTHAPLFAAHVRIAESSASASSDVSGYYALNNVPPGLIHVTVQRLGFLPSVGAVNIALGDSATTLNFALKPSPRELDAVVTTIVGDEHLIELGNSVGTIAADSVVRTAPITSLSDVLTARVPGLQVFTTGGQIGQSPMVNIRGQNSYSTGNQPLLYVDGVRVDNSAGYAQNNGRFDDIAPEDIESVQVIKGAAAATLYGTDGGNGVILVTTKRGQAGRTQLSVFGEEGAITADASRFPDSYYAWGHSSDGANSPVECTVLAQRSGQCTVDSITHFNVFTNKNTTPLATGNLSTYGLQLGGGNTATRYFVSGVSSDQVGYLYMPKDDQTILAAQRGAIGLASDEVRPDQLQKYSGRATINATVGATLDLTFLAGIVTQRSSNVGSDALIYGIEGPGYRGQNDGWFLGFVRPYADFINELQTATNTHTTNGAAANWRPMRWLLLHGDAGIDFSSDNPEESIRNGEGIFSQGYVKNTKTNTTMYTYNANAIASLPLPAGWVASTAIGGNYNKQIVDQNVSTGLNLSPGCTDLSCAVNNYGAETRFATAVAGGYSEQTFAFRDRFFAKLGVRADAGSTFGDFAAAIYPKASVSWLAISDHDRISIPGVSTARLRFAYGESGVQPPPRSTINTEGVGPAYVDGQLVDGAFLPGYGNPNLQPERDREYEGGVDLDLFQHRAHLEFTGYERTAYNQLATSTPIASISTAGTIPVNAGNVRNEGIEGLVSVQVLNTAAVSWNLSANGSINHSKVLYLPPNFGSCTYSGGGTELCKGYSMWGIWTKPIRWTDLNHDGIVEQNELTQDSAQQYLGPSYPTTQLTVAQTLSFFSGQLALRAQVDYRGGFYLLDIENDAKCSVNACRAAVDPDVPIAQQIGYASLQTFGSTNAAYWENASFARLRELSLTYKLPRRVVTALHGRSAALTVAGRNLFIWTRYRGADPEAAGANNSSNNNSANGAIGAYNDAGGVIPARYWTARVTLDF